MQSYKTSTRSPPASFLDLLPDSDEDSEPESDNKIYDLYAIDDPSIDMNVDDNDSSGSEDFVDEVLRRAGIRSRKG